MEKEQRSAIQRAVKDARNLLEGDFGSQLLEVFDIDVAKARVADGPGSHLDGEQRFLRSKLTAAIAHKQAAGDIDRQRRPRPLGRREQALGPDAGPVAGDSAEGAPGCDDQKTCHIAGLIHIDAASVRPGPGQAV